MESANCVTDVNSSSSENVAEAEDLKNKQNEATTNTDDSETATKDGMENLRADKIIDILMKTWFHEREVINSLVASLTERVIKVETDVSLMQETNRALVAKNEDLTIGNQTLLHFKELSNSLIERDLKIHHNAAESSESPKPKSQFNDLINQLKTEMIEQDISNKQVIARLSCENEVLRMLVNTLRRQQLQGSDNSTSSPNAIGNKEQLVPPKTTSSAEGSAVVSKAAVTVVPLNVLLPPQKSPLDFVSDQTKTAITSKSILPLSSSYKNTTVITTKTGDHKRLFDDEDSKSVVSVQNKSPGKKRIRLGGQSYAKNAVTSSTRDIVTVLDSDEENETN